MVARAVDGDPAGDHLAGGVEVVPGYLSYRTTSFFVTGDYGHAISSAMLVMMLALVISILK